MTVGGPTITLSNGVKMPQVGLGTWQSSPEEVKTAVKTAIETGYRLIDTAEVYGNEEAIGEALQELFKAGKLKREELFITTKLWANHMHPDDAEAALRDSLKRLQTDYVDLYLAHVPTCMKRDAPSEHNTAVKVEDIWRGLEGVYNKKLTKAIGVSNWSIEQVERAMKVAKVPIHNHQVELHLYWPQFDLHEQCKKHNISLTSYASLGSPGRVKCQPPGLKITWAPSPSPMEDANVTQLAKKYSKTPAQILLRHLMQRQIAIIPKSVTPSRIVENFKVFDFTLTDEEVKLLNASKHRQRLFIQDFLEGHPEDPYAKERKKH
ncbi:hypothetical protein Q1695_010005 [Nippostrongylus brasiliensis]|nr:hypothetical protein Q1695_010005 [Nippostrongylus brasiliensis]